MERKTEGKTQCGRRGQLRVLKSCRLSKKIQRLARAAAAVGRTRRPQEPRREVRASDPRLSTFPPPGPRGSSAPPVQSQPSDAGSREGSGDGGEEVCRLEAEGRKPREAARMLQSDTALT